MKNIIYFFLSCFLFFTCQTFAETHTDYSKSETIEDISHNIVKGIKDPLKKAEALAIFIAEHYERDGFLKKERDNAARKNKIYKTPYQNDLFETKIGDSYAFADLYQHMCQSVGLQAIVIEGYAGYRIESFGVKRKEQKAIKSAFQSLTGKPDTFLEKYKSAWNGVKIDDKWILVDTYWMVQGKKYAYKNIQTEKQMKRILEKNKRKKLKKQNFAIDMKFFNPKPKEMIKTHFPFDKTYQFLKRPYSLNKFLNQ